MIGPEYCYSILVLKTKQNNKLMENLARIQLFVYMTKADSHHYIELFWYDEDRKCNFL